MFLFKNIDLIDKLDINVWTNQDINDKGIDKVVKELLSLISSKNIKNIILVFNFISIFIFKIYYCFSTFFSYS